MLKFTRKCKLSGYNFFSILIRFLGFHEDGEIPASCQSAFDVTCLRMEERLAYSSTEQVHFISLN